MDNEQVEGVARDELILRIARAMKPRLFDPHITPESWNAPAAVFARDHVFVQARAIVEALPELRAAAEDSLVERLRYHQSEAARLMQEIAGDPCSGVVMERGEDGYLRAAPTKQGG